MNIQDYLTVQSNGFVTYCDALIARFAGDTAQSFLFSLIGSPAHVQAASAHFISGGLCRVADAGNAVFELCRSNGAVHAIRAKKIGDIVNKIMISAEHFPGRTDSSSETGMSAVVFGPDLAMVKERAFLRLDGSTTMPLKPAWRDWLWDEILHPEKLYSFGNSQLQEAWLISWEEENFEEQVLEGIRQQHLT